MRHVRECDVLAEMRAVVEEYGGDYTYRKNSVDLCRYVANGEPDCLIAKVLRRLGVPVTALSRLDSHENGDGAPPEVFHHYLDEWVTFTNHAVAAMSRAQRAQDRGYPWGEALKAAESGAASKLI